MMKTGHDRTRHTKSRSHVEDVDSVAEPRAAELSTERAVVRTAEAERSRFAPGPLAGIEPLVDHPIDPDADERLLDQAIGALDATEDQDKAVTDQAPALEPATLAEQRGLGILRLVWDADGVVIETMGSWRPLEGADEVPPSGTTARYAGSLYLNGGRSVPIDTDVVISGGGTYTDVNGASVTLVRFDAPSLVADSRFART